METTGREARDTHPAPIGRNCAHDRRPRGRAQARARDTHPAPMAPIALMIGDRGRPQAPKRVTPTRPQLAPIVLMIGDHGRPQAGARDTHPAPIAPIGPKRVTPPNT